MAATKLDKSNVTALRDEATVVVEETTNLPTFNYVDEEDDGPELQIGGGMLAREAQPAFLKAGKNLAGKNKVIFFVGRGKTGKTTGIRWMAEAAIASGRSLLMADMDPMNDTFSKYVNGVSRPPEPSNPVLALKWLDRLLQHALQTKTSLLVDLGGGDTTLRRLVEQLPDLVSMFEAEDFAVIVFYTAGPQEEDLSPLATMMGLNFHPTGTAIVLNEAMAEIGDTREAAFSRVLRHSAVREALARDAVPVWMPKLLTAQQVEIRRLPFRDAAGGHAGQGKTPLGLFDRARVKLWLDTMDANFEGVKSWLP